MKKLIPLLLLLLLFISCHKKIIRKNSDYEGNWEGEAASFLYRINIDSKSYLQFKMIGHNGNGGHASFSGTARLGNSHISVGIHRFHIIQTPTKIDTTKSSIPLSNGAIAQWQMLLETSYGGGS